MEGLKCKSVCMNHPLGQTKVAVVERWPLYRAGRCRGVAVSGCLTV